MQSDDLVVILMQFVLCTFAKVKEAFVVEFASTVHPKAFLAVFPALSDTHVEVSQNNKIVIKPLVNLELVFISWLFF